MLRETYLDLSVQSTLLVVKLLIIVREHLEVVESKLLLNALLESLALLDGQGVGLGNDWNDIDNVGELLEDDTVDRLQRVTRGLDEKQAAVDASIGNVALPLGCELLAQVRGVLILDVLHNWVPAAIVVDEVTVSRSVNNVESQANTILLDDVGHGLDLCGGADGLLGLKATLGIDKVGSKDGVDQGRLSHTSRAYISSNQSVSKYQGGVAESRIVTQPHEETRARWSGQGGRRRLTNADDVELETTLQELALNLRRDAVETDMGLGVDAARGSRGHCDGGFNDKLSCSIRKRFKSRHGDAETSFGH
jgi:hypothetical protein